MTRGLVAGRGGKPATKARRVHKRWAPWAYWGMLLAAALGTATTWFLRADLDTGDTLHFWLGWFATGLMGTAWLAIRYRKGRPWLRKVHPWLGGIAVVIALVQMMLGFEMLP